MRSSHFLISIVLLIACLGNAAASSSIRLPTGQLLEPAGATISLDGTMAANVVRVPGKPWIVAICCGARQSVSLVDINTKKVLSTVLFQNLNSAHTGYVPTGDAYYGLAVSADGKTVYVARGGEDKVTSYTIGVDGKLSESLDYADVASSATSHNYVAGVALDEGSQTIYTANNMTDSVSVLPLSSGLPLAGASTLEPPLSMPLPIVVYYAVKSYPLAVAVDDEVHKVYVSSERDSAVSVIDIGGSQPAAVTSISVGSHPDALCLTRDGSRLFVANGDSDTVSIVETGSDRVLNTILLRPTLVAGLPGATPTGLCLSPDQKTLYVSLADMNAVAVVKLGSGLADGGVQGYIPTGWYPSAVTTDATGGRLIVANAKGNAPRVPNPDGPSPVKDSQFYVHNILTSTLSLIAVPTQAELASMTREVLLDNSISRPIDSNSVANAALLARLPIKHVIYIIKENRTYDEVLGDLPTGNGDPSLVLFGKEVTPNLHALESGFVTLDNFYCCAEVSADGWNWSTSGFANEYVQRNVPELYSESDGSARPEARTYDFEGNNRHLAVSDRGMPDVAESPGGYIWDSVKNANLSYRNYGAFLSDDGNRPAKPALLKHTDYDFSFFDVKYADSDAYINFGLPSPGKSSFGPDKMPSSYTAWKSEFDKYVAAGDLPSFELVRFMRDHTAGTSPGTNTPQAMAADNDYAVGELVDAVSHSPYWKSTAIFVIEDDAQDGPDHIDCHRSTCYVISPYVKRNSVDHGFYNTDSVLRTMELLLHTSTMTRLDSSAHPFASFTSTPDFTPYTAVVPDRTLIGSWNVASDYGSFKSQKMDFAVADDVPEDALNQILWHSIKGAGSLMPMPRHRVLGQ